MNISDMLFEADLLEKAAETIQELQSKLESANNEVELLKQASLNPVIKDLKTKGFTEEEARGLANSLPENTLQKVAKFTESSGTMFEMGSPSSRKVGSEDPLLAFLQS